MTPNRWPNLPDTTASQIDDALARGNKIEAIKLYRQATNCGLKEAKEAIEQAEAAMPKDWRKDSITPQTKRPNSNWLTWLITLIIVASILWVILIALR